MCCYLDTHVRHAARATQARRAATRSTGKGGEGQPRPQPSAVEASIHRDSYVGAEHGQRAHWQRAGGQPFSPKGDFSLPLLAMASSHHSSRGPGDLPERIHRRS